MSDIAPWECPIIKRACNDSRLSFEDIGYLVRVEAKNHIPDAIEPGDMPDSVRRLTAFGYLGDES